MRSFHTLLTEALSRITEDEYADLEDEDEFSDGGERLVYQGNHAGHSVRLYDDDWGETALYIDGVHEDDITYDQITAVAQKLLLPRQYENVMINAQYLYDQDVADRTVGNLDLEDYVRIAMKRAITLNITGNDEPDLHDLTESAGEYENLEDRDEFGTARVVWSTDVSGHAITLMDAGEWDYVAIDGAPASGMPATTLLNVLQGLTDKPVDALMRGVDGTGVRFPSRPEQAQQILDSLAAGKTYWRIAVANAISRIVRDLCYADD